MAKRIRRVVRSKSWHSKVRRVLSPTHPETHAQIARLIVLYEDMKIEAIAASRKKTFLDFAGSDHRRFYFIRGSLQTFREVHSAFTGLKDDRQFHKILGRMAPQNKKTWNAAVDFFASNAEQIRKVRNVVGGHFSIAAGRCVIEHTDQDTDARMEIAAHRSGLGAGVTFTFASELVAVGMTESRGDLSQIEFLEGLFKMMMEAYRHFAAAIHVLTDEYIVPRFEG